MQKECVVTPGYKETHGATVLVTVSIRIPFFCCRLLEVDEGFGLEATPCNLGKGLSSGQNSSLAHSQTILRQSAVKIQNSPVDLTYPDPPLRLRILRTSPLAHRAGFLETI